MSIKDLVHNLAINSDGGIAALAARMRIPYSTLKNKLNPNCDTHHLYAEELGMIATYLDTDEIAKWFAEQRDGVFVKSIPLDDLSDEALLDLFMQRDESNGEFAKMFRDGYSDGHIDEREFKELMRQHDNTTAIREQIKARVTAIYQESKARSRRCAQIKAIK